MELSRRLLLAGAATAASASALGLPAATPARAQGAPMGQAPGFYRYKVGDIVVTVVTDGARVFPLPDNFVRNASKADVGAALANSFLPADTLTIPFNPLVVQTGGRVVVIDTGLGAGTFAQSKGAMGQFHTNLKAAGFDSGAVDAVVISHFHGDHINGLVDAEGKPAFGKAEVLVPEAEWAYWSSDENMSKAAGTPREGAFKNARRVFDPLKDRVKPYAAEKEVAPGITAVATHGHTPGHSSHVIASGNDSVFVQADVTNIPQLFVRNPGWHVMFDMDAQMAEDTRRKLYDRLAAEKLRVQGFHYPFPSLGHVEKDGSGYRLTPTPWNPVL